MEERDVREVEERDVREGEREKKREWTYISRFLIKLRWPDCPLSLQLH